MPIDNWVSGDGPWSGRGLMPLGYNIREGENRGLTWFVSAVNTLPQSEVNYSGNVTATGERRENVQRPVHAHECVLTMWRIPKGLCNILALSLASTHFPNADVIISLLKIISNYVASVVPIDWPMVRTNERTRPTEAVTIDQSYCFGYANSTFNQQILGESGRKQKRYKSRQKSPYTHQHSRFSYIFCQLNKKHL